jgi:hypothetical protein
MCSTQAAHTPADDRRADELRRRRCSHLSVANVGGAGSVAAQSRRSGRRRCGQSAFASTAVTTPHGCGLSSCCLHLCELAVMISASRAHSTGAGEDTWIDHNKSCLRFPYVFTFSRSHYLHPHPYSTLLRAECRLNGQEAQAAAVTRASCTLSLRALSVRELFRGRDFVRALPRQKSMPARRTTRRLVGAVRVVINA